MSRASLQTVGGSRNESMNRTGTMLPEANYLLSRRTGSDFDYRRASIEMPTIDKCFGFDDDDDGEDNDDNRTIELPSKEPATKGQSSALSTVRSGLKRFLHGTSTASTKKQSQTNANKRNMPNLFKSPAKDKPANVVDIFDKNKQKNICSALEAKSSNGHNIEPSNLQTKRVVLFEEDVTVS